MSPEQLNKITVQLTCSGCAKSLDQVSYTEYLEMQELGFVEHRCMDCSPNSDEPVPFFLAQPKLNTISQIARIQMGDSPEASINHSEAFLAILESES